MGMFDYIECKMPLPAAPPPPRFKQFEKFQTKDTPTGQLSMETWTIEADGRLIYHEPEYAWEPNEGKEGLEAIAGALKTKSITDREIPHHGDICFYHLDLETKEWWEYVARFTDGRCTEIWLSEYTPPETSHTSTHNKTETPS